MENKLPKMEKEVEIEAFESAASWKCLFTNL
jgi:hypothetical protein